MFFSFSHSHDLRTMEDFYHPSLIGRGGPIVSTTVPGTDFVLKNHMVQLLRHNCQFHGFEGEDANDHLNKYLSITQFIKQNEVSQDIINLNLFPFSLTYEAESWFYTLKTHSIHTWEEMVSKFLSKYFPYSRTLQLRKEILNFFTMFFSFYHSHDLRTMEDFYRPSLIGRGGPIIPTTIPGTDFVLKNHMVQLLRQNCQFHGFEDSDESDDDEPSKMIEDQKSIHHLNGSPTPSSDPVVTSLSPSPTPTGDSDSILEETDTLLSHHDSTSPEVDDDIFDPEGDICLLERLLNLDSTKYLPPPHELNNEIFDPKGDIRILENLLKDDPSEAKNSKIDLLIKGPSDTFLMGDEDIKLNPPMDVDNLVPIPMVSEKPLDSLDPILETSKTTITGPLFDFDSEFTLNSDNPILDIQNKESDKSEMETIMDEVQINSTQSTAQILPQYEKLNSDSTMPNPILTFLHFWISSCF
ncbi:reverse transcriptase domain-containing protein [Tanacetum coccineum]